MRKGGFTLIELLVVIVIIGLLAAVVLASLNTARAKARDARRVSDLREVQKALEFYFDTNGRYPAHGTNTQLPEIASSLAPTYIPSIPSDPTRSGGSGYRYCSDATNNNNQSYTMLAFSEARGGWCSMVGGAYNNCSWNDSYALCGQ